MKLYYVGHGEPTYFKDRREAHALLRDLYKASDSPPDFFDLLLVEIKPDVPSLLKILNGTGGYQTTLQRWELTRRGGLKEVAVEAAPVPVKGKRESFLNDLI